MTKKIDEIIAAKTSNKKLDRELDEQLNLPTHSENVELVSVSRLRPYANHPFKIYNTKKMNALAENIEREGLHQPVIVRPAEGNYEILAGHNRVEAMRTLGIRDIPVIVRYLDDDDAALVVVNTNLRQRERLLPSEKAFAYKMQIEALRANAFREKTQIEFSGNSVDRNEIQRYIRLTQLLPELLEKVDDEKIPVMAGYELSFLNAAAQRAVYEYFFNSGVKDRLTLKNAEIIRSAYKRRKKITPDSLSVMLSKPAKKKNPATYTFSHKALAGKYKLPEGFDLDAFVHEKLSEEFGKVNKS